MKLSAGFAWVLLAGVLTSISGGHVSARQPEGLVLSLVPTPPRRKELPPIPSISEKAAEALTESCVGTTHGAEILGDLLPIRNATITLDNPEARRALSASYISQDARTAEQLLAPFVSSTNPRTAYLAALVVAHVKLRATATFPSEDELAKLQVLGVAASLSTADVQYFRTLASLRTGNLREARGTIEDALQQEPLFFNAHMARMVIELRAYSLVEESEAECAPALARLAVSLRDLTHLSPCPLQAVYVDAFVDSGTNLNKAGLGVALSRGYLAVLSRKPSIAINRLTELQRRIAAIQRRGICNEIIDGEITNLLRLAETLSRRSK